MAYFVYAMIHDVANATPLIALTATVVFIVSYETLKKRMFGVCKDLYSKNCELSEEALEKLKM